MLVAVQTFSRGKHLFVVRAYMLALSHNLQIPESVISDVSVSVVHDFPGKQCTP
jgi:hypothetical protein